MGIVQRQGIRIAIVSYLGVLIGALNTLFVFPQVLGPEKQGLLMLYRQSYHILVQEKCNFYHAYFDHPQLMPCLEKLY